MTRFLTDAAVQTTASLTLNESELRALEALTGYDMDNFLKAFYTQMGVAYLKPHEAGLRSLFRTIQAEVPAILSQADAARQAFKTKQPVIITKAAQDEFQTAVHDVKRLTSGKQEAARCIHSALNEMQPGGPNNPQEENIQTMLAAALGTLGEPMP